MDLNEQNKYLYFIIRLEKLLPCKDRVKGVKDKFGKAKLADYLKQ
jgi:hypothetical protein